MADVSALVSQMNETLAEIHQTIGKLDGSFFDAELDELEQQRDAAISALQASFGLETEDLQRRRRARHDELVERRRREDEEREERRRREEEELAALERDEDELRTAKLADETRGVEQETDERMDEVEAQAARAIEDGERRLAELEARRQEINRLIDERMKAPLPTAPVRARRARGASRQTQAKEAVNDKVAEAAPAPTPAPAPAPAARSTVVSQIPEEVEETGGETLNTAQSKSFLGSWGSRMKSLVARAPASKEETEEEEEFTIRNLDDIAVAEDYVPEVYEQHVIRQQPASRRASVSSRRMSVSSRRGSICSIVPGTPIPGTMTTTSQTIEFPPFNRNVRLSPMTPIPGTMSAGGGHSRSQSHHLGVDSIRATTDAAASRHSRARSVSAMPMNLEAPDTAATEGGFKTLRRPRSLSRISLNGLEFIPGTMSSRSPAPSPHYPPQPQSRSRSGSVASRSSSRSPSTSPVFGHSRSLSGVEETYHDTIPSALPTSRPGSAAGFRSSSRSPPLRRPRSISSLSGRYVEDSEVKTANMRSASPAPPSSRPGSAAGFRKSPTFEGAFPSPAPSLRRQRSNSSLRGRDEDAIPGTMRSASPAPSRPPSSAGFRRSPMIEGAFPSPAPSLRRQRSNTSLRGMEVDAIPGTMTSASPAPSRPQSAAGFRTSPPLEGSFRYPSPTLRRPRSHSSLSSREVGSMRSASPAPSRPPSSAGLRRSVLGANEGSVRSASPAPSSRPRSVSAVSLRDFAIPGTMASSSSGPSRPPSAGVRPPSAGFRPPSAGFRPSMLETETPIRSPSPTHSRPASISAIAYEDRDPIPGTMASPRHDRSPSKNEIKAPEIVIPAEVEEAPRAEVLDYICNDLTPVTPADTVQVIPSPIVIAPTPVDEERIENFPSALASHGQATLGLGLNAGMVSYSTQEDPITAPGTDTEDKTDTNATEVVPQDDHTNVNVPTRQTEVPILAPLPSPKSPRKGAPSLADELNDASSQGGFDDSDVEGDADDNISVAHTDDSRHSFRAQTTSIQTSPTVDAPVEVAEQQIGPDAVALTVNVAVPQESGVGVEGAVDAVLGKPVSRLDTGESAASVVHRPTSLHESVDRDSDSEEEEGSDSEDDDDMGDQFDLVAHQQVSVVPEPSSPAMEHSQTFVNVQYGEVSLIKEPAAVEHDMDMDSHDQDTLGKAAQQTTPSQTMLAEHEPAPAKLTSPDTDSFRQPVPAPLESIADTDSQAYLTPLQSAGGNKVELVLDDETLVKDPIPMQSQSVQQDKTEDEEDHQPHHVEESVTVHGADDLFEDSDDVSRSDVESIQEIIHQVPKQPVQAQVQQSVEDVAAEVPKFVLPDEQDASTPKNPTIATEGLMSDFIDVDPNTPQTSVEATTLSSLSRQMTPLLVPTDAANHNQDISPLALRQETPVTPHKGLADSRHAPRDLSTPLSAPQSAAQAEPASPIDEHDSDQHSLGPETPQVESMPWLQGSESVSTQPQQGHQADYETHETSGPLDSRSESTNHDQEELDDDHDHPDLFVPRDVTHMSWHARNDSVPMSMHSQTTLSSAPSSPVHASLPRDNHEPVIRESWPAVPHHQDVLAGMGGISTDYSNRPRNYSQATDYSRARNISELSSFDPFGPGSQKQALAVNNNWPPHQETPTTETEQEPRMAPTTTSNKRNSVGAGASPSGIFQRMRSVFEKPQEGTEGTAAPPSPTRSRPVSGVFFPVKAAPPPPRPLEAGGGVLTDASAAAPKKSPGLPTYDLNKGYYYDDPSYGQDEESERSSLLAGR